MVTRLTLNQVIQVQILVPQPFIRIEAVTNEQLSTKSPPSSSSAQDAGFSFR